MAEEPSGGQDPQEPRDGQDQEAAPSTSAERKRWNTDGARAIAGGAVTLAIGLGGATLLGSVNHWEARRLVESLDNTLPYFASAGIGASVSVLALMITLLGLSRRTKLDLSETFYKRILWIGRQASALFAGSVFLLLVMAAPVANADAENGSRNYAIAQFYVTASLTAIAAGLFVSLVLMLQSTLSDLVQVVGLRVDDHPLIAENRDAEGTEA